MNNLLPLITLLFSCHLLLRFITPSRVTEFILSFFLIACTLITTWGYILAGFGQLGNLAAWRNIGTATFIFLLIALVVKKKKPRHAISWSDTTEQVRKVLSGYSPHAKFIVPLMALTTIITSVGILFLIITIRPHDWDSMTYHLPRMAHYLQVGNLDYFDANYWAQVVHPKNSTLLLLYTFLTFGRNEFLTQFPQFISYWMISVGVYGVTRRIGFDFTQGLFTSCVSSLIISGITQANSAQNDLILSAFISSSVYFLFAFRNSQNKMHLILAALGIGLAAGTKFTFLIVMPSIMTLVLALTGSKNNRMGWYTNLAVTAAYVLIAMFFFILPSGYVENYKIFGNPFGSQDVNALHTFDKAGTKSILHGGFYNFLRYGVDFISLGGLPPTAHVVRIQKYMHYPPQITLPLFDIYLDSREATSFSWFEYGVPSRGSYWGVLGFGFIWVVTALSLLRIIRRTDFFLLASASLIFWISLSWSAPYDASKGRYFSMCIVFAAPLTAIILDTKHRGIQAYLTTIAVLGCMSAISAVVLKTMPISATYSEFIEKDSLLEMDRLEQLTFNYQKYHRPFVAFEFLVPADAVVAVYLYPNTFEYPLYGQYLTRKIIPINSFYKGIQAIPPEAEYLLYARGYPCPLPEDRQLGDNSGIFLRILNEDNRKCDAASRP